MKSNVVKLFVFLMFVVIVAASCRGPKECWGVSSDASGQSTEQTTDNDC